MSIENLSAAAQEKAIECGKQLAAANCQFTGNISNLELATLAPGAGIGTQERGVEGQTLA